MPASLTDRIVGEFPRMPPRLQAAARFVLDQPQEVALLSMREQAKRAGVSPVTMTRLAQRLGLPGYDEIRHAYATEVRKSTAGYGERATDLVTRRGKGSSAALIAEMANTLARHVAMLAEPATAKVLAAAADDLSDAGQIYCLGQRSSFPVAYMFHYICTLAGRDVTLLDRAGETGIDALVDARKSDALLAISVKPYTRRTIEAAQQAQARGLKLVAITDSAVSPLAAIARHAIVVDTASPSYFEAKSAALAAAEILALLVTIRGGAQSLAAVKKHERHLAAADAYWRPPSRRQTR